MYYYPKDFSTYNTYRIGSAYTIAEGLQFKINKSTAVKTPTLYELYGSDNYGYSGNPKWTELTSDQQDDHYEKLFQILTKTK